MPENPPDQSGHLRDQKPAVQLQTKGFFSVPLQHRQEKVFLGRKEIVETAATRVGLLQNL